MAQSLLPLRDGVFFLNSIGTVQGGRDVQGSRAQNADLARGSNRERAVTRRAASAQPGESFIRLKAKGGSFYWVSFDGYRLLRGDTFWTPTSSSRNSSRRWSVRARGGELLAKGMPDAHDHSFLDKKEGAEAGRASTPSSPRLGRRRPAYVSVHPRYCDADHTGHFSCPGL
jgi:hypothetical protein